MFKKYWINPSFQLQLVTFFLILSIIKDIFFYINARSFYVQIIDEIRTLKNVDATIVDQSVIDGLNHLTGDYLLNASLLTLFIIIGGIVVTARVAKSVDKMKNYVTEVTDGKEDTDLDLGKKDFFKDLAQAIVRLVKTRARS